MLALGTLGQEIPGRRQVLNRARTLVILFGAAGVAWLAYWPGLSSGFIFDDFGNLSLLGDYGRVDDWNSFWLYLTSGFAGPTGRPLALLSFLIDSNTWPADPWPFKRTNLVIHLINGALLFAVSRGLAEAAALPRSRAVYCAFLVAGVWLFHPLWVSTTLYAVQRMTQLSALFTLAGLWAWISLRLRQPPVLNRRWLLCAPLIVAGVGTLAVLSKENGALLPVYIVTLEVTLFAHLDRCRGVQPSRAFTAWRWLCLGVPSLLVVLYLARSTWAFYGSQPESFEFTPLERVLTQARVLWEYIYQLAVPGPTPGGLWHDGIVLSTGLVSPWTTLPAVVGLIGLLVGAWLWRRRHPALSAAVLFFFAGHLIESTVIRLDLYYEHRNYLAAALGFFPVAVWWAQRIRIPHHLHWLLPATLILLLAIMTGMRSNLWAQPFQQALQWVEDRPGSPRAHHHLANLWRETDHIRHARSVNQRAIELAPKGLTWRISEVSYACMLNDDPDGATRQLIHLINQTGQTGKHARHRIKKLIHYLRSGSCPAYPTNAELLPLLRELRRAGGGDGKYNRLLVAAEAQTHLELGNKEKAIDRYRQVVRSTTRPSVQLGAAAKLATAGHHEAAVAILEMEPPRPSSRGPLRSKVRRWYLESTHYYDNERAHLRRTIEKKMDEQP